MKHNVSTYNKHRCRCQTCRDAKTAQQLRLRAERAIRLAANPDITVHGSMSTYTNWGCRCRPCTDANSAYWAARRAALRAERAS